MRALVTVGSTGFDDLIGSVMRPEILSALYELGYDHLTVQYGSSDEIYRANLAQIVTTPSRTPVIEGYNYKSDIKNDMKASDLIISHAGKYYLQCLPNSRFHRQLTADA